MGKTNRLNSLWHGRNSLLQFTPPTLRRNFQTMPELKLDKSTPKYAIPPSLRSRENTYRGVAKYGGVSLYVLYCRGYAKIGLSTDVKKRTGNIQAACPFPVNVIFQYSMPKKRAMKAEIETMLELDAFHFHHDWFKCSRGHAIYAAQKVVDKLQR